MKILVACEYSGIVRNAFLTQGHEAMSCDLLPTDAPGPHYQGDVRDILGEGWDMVAAFPPCTDLCVSGARWFPAKRASGEQAASIAFFMLFPGSAPRVVIENPVGIMSSVWRKPDQVIQPWQFGHGETKATCLWLEGLPPLMPTHRENDLFCADAPKERLARVHLMPPGPNRWKERSRTFAGIAAAMADQWGALDRCVLNP